MAVFYCHPGLFLSSQVDSPERDAALQRIAAPEQDAASLDSAVQSATAASDIFMLGAVTYEALVGKPAFPAKSDGLNRGGRWQVQQSHHQQTHLSLPAVMFLLHGMMSLIIIGMPWIMLCSCYAHAMLMLRSCCRSCYACSAKQRYAQTNSV